MRIFRLAFFSQFSDGDAIRGRTVLPSLRITDTRPRTETRPTHIPIPIAFCVGHTPQHHSRMPRVEDLIAADARPLGRTGIGSNAEDWDQGMLDEWLFRQMKSPFTCLLSARATTSYPPIPFTFFNSDIMQSACGLSRVDLRSDLGDFQALQKTFADLQRLEAASLTRFFIQCSNAYAPEKQAQPSYDLSPQAKPSDAVVSAVEAALLAFPNELLQSLEEYGVKLPVQYKAFLPFAAGIHPPTYSSYYVALDARRNHLVAKPLPAARRRDISSIIRRRGRSPTFGSHTKPSITPYFSYDAGTSGARARIHTGTPPFPPRQARHHKQLSWKRTLRLSLIASIWSRRS